MYSSASLVYTLTFAHLHSILPSFSVFRGLKYISRPSETQNGLLLLEESPSMLVKRKKKIRPDVCIEKQFSQKQGLEFERERARERYLLSIHERKPQCPVRQLGE